MIRRVGARLGSVQPIEPQRLCPRYRRREIQYGTKKGTGFGEKFRSWDRCGEAGAISGGTAVCDVRPRDKWKSALVDGIGFYWTRRAHISLVGLPAELVSKANRNPHRCPPSQLGQSSGQL